MRPSRTHPRVGWREKGGFGRPFFASRAQGRPATPGDTRTSSDARRKTCTVARCAARAPRPGARGHPDVHSRKTQDARLVLTYPIENSKFKT